LLRFLNYILAVCTIILISVGGFSQQPTYYHIGEKELANVDVYSILQTSDERLIIATDHGLFEFHQNKFEAIAKHKDQKGSGLYNLIENKKGEVYCCNLTGQIFQLQQQKLKLHFEVPKQYLTSSTILRFDDSDNLIFASKGFYKISDNKIELIYNNKETYYSLLNKLPNNELILSSEFKDSLLFIKNGVIVSEPLSPDYKGTISAFSQILLLEGKLLINYNGAFYWMNNESIPSAIPIIGLERYYQFNDEEIWSLLTSKGIRSIRLKNDTLVAQNYFPDRFISSITNGGNGTLFLGTFGQGVLVVPNRNMLQHELNSSPKNLNHLAVDKSNNVFITENGKGVIHYNTTPTVIEMDETSNFQNVFYTPGINFGAIKNFPGLYFDKPLLFGKKNNITPVKDICKIDNNKVVIVTSFGIFVKKADQLDYNTIDYTGIRYNAVVYDEKNAYIYTASNTGVIQRDKEGNDLQLKYKGEEMRCSDLLFYDEKLWCPTQEYGILSYKNGVFTEEYDVTKGLKSNAIRKLEVQGNLLFLLNNGGVQYINLNTREVTTLAKAEGVMGYVNDFALSKDKLWMITDNTDLISADLRLLPQAPPALSLSLDSIVVSGLKRGVEISAPFKFDDKPFQFYVNLKNIHYQEQGIIYYRIKGFEKVWNSMSATASLIEYRSLPTGDYQFEVYASYGNSKSLIISKQFVIELPFWKTWKFYLLITITTILFILVVAYLRIKAIRKNNKEKIEKQTLKTNLLDTELKALRSQMNPHFIFNSLNSIQDLILQEDTDSSYDYIVLFANLVRSTLNYSNQDFIPIEKEMEFLETYLKLENLRFEEDFSYKLNYSGSSELQVPSLIVQPFIENALFHGLLHKSGKKTLEINFEFNTQLTCTITDNGVGRARAKEIQERQGHLRESFALSAIKKRLAILSENHKGAGYTVHDLFEDNQATGTRVKVVMPFKEPF